MNLDRSLVEKALLDYYKNDLLLTKIINSWEYKIVNQPFFGDIEIQDKVKIRRHGEHHGM